jgi:hypothetical protein
LEVVVEGARAERVFAIGLAGNFLHDGVSVELAAGEGHEDVEQRGRERRRLFFAFAYHTESDISDFE